MIRIEPAPWESRWPDRLAMLVLLTGAVAMVGPFVWMLSTSLKLPEDQYARLLIPPTVTFENYSKIFEIMSFQTLLWNSIKIALISTFGQLLTCSMAAFVFAVVKFPGRHALFVLLGPRRRSTCRASSEVLSASS
jgi:ABC-type glycerol-3-phosphate transport system permease component